MGSFSLLEELRGLDLLLGNMSFYVPTIEDNTLRQNVYMYVKENQVKTSTEIRR